MEPATLDGFVAERVAIWAELATLAAGVTALSPGQVLRLSAAYRATSADLALARRRYPGAPLVSRLEELVAQGRDALADVPPAGVAAALLRFATRDWWRLVAGSLRYAATAAGLLAAALLAAVAWTLADPRAAERTLPVADRRIPLAAAPRGLADATGLPRGIPALPASWTPAAALALAVLALAGGLLAGLGTVAALGALGLELGVPAGLALGSGQGAPLAGLLAADGLLLLVLTCLVAGEGLRLGLAVVDPGRRPRGEAVVAAARRGTLVLAGALPAYGVAALLAAAVRADGPWPVAPGGLVAVAALAAGTARLGRPRHARSAARPEE